MAFLLDLVSYPQSPRLVEFLKSVFPSEGPCFLILQGEVRPYSKRMCLFQAVGLLQDWYKVLASVFHSLELTQDDKTAGTSQNVVRQTSNLQPHGGRRLQLTQTTQK